MASLSKTELVEKLRGVPGWYIFHEKGTYTLREADGSVIRRCQDNSLTTCAMLAGSCGMKTRIHGSFSRPLRSDERPARHDPIGGAASRPLPRSCEISYPAVHKCLDLDAWRAHISRLVEGPDRWCPLLLT
jgi:hypothetical protein